MSPALPAPRADLYATIHKALRARLTGLLTAAGSLDHGDDAAVAALLAELRDTLTLCGRHLELEERHVHPALEARRPGASRHAQAEHAQHLQSLEELQTIAFRLEHLPALRRAPVALELYRALARHVAADLEHMALEESENNRALWETHSDDEIRAIEQALRAELTPAERTLSMAAMLPALNPAERAAMLGGMRADAPAAFDQALAMARRTLSSADLRKLESALGIERTLAEYVGLL